MTQKRGQRIEPPRIITEEGILKWKKNNGQLHIMGMVDIINITELEEESVGLIGVISSDGIEKSLSACQKGVQI